MTILAGAIGLSATSSISDANRAALRRLVSSDQSDVRQEHRFASAYMVKVDIGAFAERALHVDESGAVSMLAGEPLITTGDIENGGRDTQLVALHREWTHDAFNLTRWSSGTFCAAFFDPKRKVGHLVADRLGLRTLYYAVVGDVLYFASAFRILEALDAIPKVVDLQALVEITGFGYPFGACTPYAGIHMLLPCEVLTIGPVGVSSKRYFEWDAIQPTHHRDGQWSAEIHRLFRRAILRRLRVDRTSFAYLSGGLDSRCVVAALRAEQVHTYTFNFSLPKTQDQVFALQYAGKCGAVHHELPTEPGPNWSAVMADAWSATPHRRVREAERPHLVWTGEGGSVGLGHVYISPEIVEQLRAGDWDGGIETFLRQQRKAVVARILKPQVAEHFGGHLQARLRTELLSIRQTDPVRALYIFLNLNGPRRHLVNHFETIDHHRLEFQLPFYDSELMEYLTSLPVDPCLYHKLYVKWLSHFDASVTEVPWQVYPGHEPSVVPAPAEVFDQWSMPASKAHNEKLRANLNTCCKVMLSTSDFPAHALNRWAISMMRIVWRARLANYEYALKAALTYYKYLRTHR